MQPEELQFYEALRQQAIENIEGSSEKTGRPFAYFGRDYAIASRLL